MAVNLVNAVTINRILLYQGQPGTSIATVYTVPGATTVKLASIVLCNTTTSSATVTISVVPLGGTAGVANRIASSLSVGANATTVIETPVYMNAGDFIAALQGTASAITVTVSGETYA